MPRLDGSKKYNKDSARAHKSKHSKKSPKRQNRVPGSNLKPPKQNKPPAYNSHHLRPKARGGADKELDPTNEVQKPKVRIHDSYHTLFAADRPHDILSSILQRWETTSPHLEAELPGTDHARLAKRTRAWNKLFGGPVTPCEAAAVIITHFVSHNRHEDKNLALREIDRAEKLGTITNNEAEYLRNLINR